MITQAGMYRMTLDMMEYTYTLEELGFAPYIYEIGNNTSWSGTCPLAGINFDGKYRGFAYLNGEFKYKPNPEKDNWTGDWEKVSGDERFEEIFGKEKCCELSALIATYGK